MHCKRRVQIQNLQRAVNMLQKPLARRNSAMDAIKTLLERRVDAVGTL